MTFLHHQQALQFCNEEFDRAAVEEYRRLYPQQRPMFCDEWIDFVAMWRGK